MISNRNESQIVIGDPIQPNAFPKFLFLFVIIIKKFGKAKNMIISVVSNYVGYKLTIKKLIVVFKFSVGVVSAY